MTTETAPRGLHVKLAEVMAEAERIPKRGTAPAAMGGFPFVQVGDAADAIRAALGARGVSMLPSAIDVIGEAEHATSTGKTMTTLTVRTTWTLVDGETGQSAVIQSIGAGADMGDKSAPKAQTSAMKYALLMGFLLSTGDDVEQSDTSDRQQRTYRSASPDPRPVPSPRGGGASHTDGPWEGPVSFGKPPTDGHVRETPDGSVFGFVITEAIEGKERGRRNEVVAEGAFAEALDFAFKTGRPESAMVWGRLEMVPWDKDGKAMPPYRRIHAQRVMTPEWTLPATQPVAGGSVAPGEAPDDLSDLPW